MNEQRRKTLSNVVRIGLMGGTFDPPHIGHFRLAIEALESLHLNEVKLIPVNIPSHRSKPIASPSARVEMLTRVAQDPLNVDVCEIQRGGVSFSIDTVKFMKNKLPNAKLFLIIGLDSFLSFKEWAAWEELLRLTNLAVFARDGGDPTLKEQYLKEFSGYSEENEVIFLDSPILEVGSTEIRNKIKNGLNVDYLLPEKVFGYIQAEKLYRND